VGLIRRVPLGRERRRAEVQVALQEWRRLARTWAALQARRTRRTQERERERALLASAQWRMAEAAMAAMAALLALLLSALSLPLLLLLPLAGVGTRMLPSLPGVVGCRRERRRGWRPARVGCRA
jgi:hypothetical protein